MINIDRLTSNVFGSKVVRSLITPGTIHPRPVVRKSAEAANTAFQHKQSIEHFIKKNTIFFQNKMRVEALLLLRQCCTVNKTVKLY